MRLLAIFHLCALPRLLQKGARGSLHRSSCAKLVKPEATLVSKLFSMVMSSTTAMLPLSDVRTVRTMAKPHCAANQLFSKILPETITRRALLNSRLFFADHCAAGGNVTPGFAQRSGL